jgi:carboxymethylenebutenolidase
LTWMTLDISDGSRMRAFVARPTGNGPHPGMIVLQEAFGVDAHIRDVAGRFAKEGFTAIAPELYHRTAPGFEGDYNDFDALRPHMSAMTVDGQVADLDAVHRWLGQDAATDSDRLAAIGFCMGGRVAFLANTALPLRAAVSHYGGGIPTLLDRVGTLHGPQLFYWAGQDRRILPEQHRSVVDALRNAGKPFVNVEFSQANHGFFNDARASYGADAAHESWALTLAFLARHVKA